jgi:hypothetical protein
VFQVSWKILLEGFLGGKLVARTHPLDFVHLIVHEQNDRRAQSFRARAKHQRCLDDSNGLAG